MGMTYVGSRLRQLRKERDLTQAALAELLGISASYINQIEHDVRPLTPQVLRKITASFGVDATFFSRDDSSRLIAELQDVMFDKEVCPQPIDVTELSTLVDHHPEAARAMVEMHRRYRRLRDNLDAVTDKRRLSGLDTPNPLAMLSMPHDEVRDFFYSHHNYLDELDRIAERIATELGITTFNIRANEAALTQRLQEDHDVEIIPGVDLGATLHKFDNVSRQLTLSTRLIAGQRAFRLAAELGYLEAGEQMYALVSDGHFQSEEARRLALRGIASYFAAAVMLPYGMFHSQAEKAVTTSNISAKSLDWDMRRSAIGFQPCNALSSKAFRLRLSAWIVPEISPSGNRPLVFISRILEARALCGTYMRLSAAQARS